MAPRLRSSKNKEKSAESPQSETVDSFQLVPSSSQLNSSFSIPPPGVDTQAIIDEIATAGSEFGDLDNLLESDFLLFSPQKDDNQLEKAPNSENPPPEETNETTGVDETVKSPEKNPRKRGRKPKQSLEKLCPVCPKTVHFMRQHLIKAHGWSGKPLQFILSVMATEKVKSPVYECQNCLLRFTHRQRHLDKNPDCEVIRVTRDTKEVYPKEIIHYMKDQRVLSDRGWDIMNQYQQYCTIKLKKPLANYQIDFLSKLFRATASFKKPEVIGDVFNSLKEEKNYTFSSLRKLCFDAKAFIRWLASGQQKSYRVNKSSLDAAIGCWLNETSKDCLKEQKERKEERFAEIPTMEMLCEVQDLVENFIDSRCEIDSQWHKLTVKEKLSLLLFQIHSRANCRVGTLLNFTVKDLEDYQPGNYIRSHDHKTGSIFTSFAYITNSEKQLLQSLHREYEAEFKVQPSVIFPGNYDKDLTTQSTNIAKLLKKLFQITDFKFHPNACRKVWDTYYFKNKEKIPQQLQRLFESNTGHSDKTRQLHYTLPPTNDDLQSLFEATGKIRKECREKRRESASTSRLVPDEQSTVLEAYIQEAAESEIDLIPSTSATKSPVKNLPESNAKIDAKNVEEQSESLPSDDESMKKDKNASSDFSYKPPFSFKVKKNREI